MSRITVALAVLAMLLGVSIGVHAAMINNTLGNDMPGFNDGDTPFVFTVGAAQSGQPPPFDTSYGTDGLFGVNFMQMWTHSFGMISDPILSAVVTIGIYDHDSSASGSQLGLFTFAGIDLTTALDGLFEAGGGAESEYNEYSLMLPGTSFAALATGSAAAQLNLQGPGLSPPSLFPPGPSMETTTNGANLIFSTLTIQTQDAMAMPEPATWGLFVLGLGSLLWYRRRQEAGMQRRQMPISYRGEV